MKRLLRSLYGTEDRKHNGCIEIEVGVVPEARVLSRVPQVLTMITVKDGKIVQVEGR